MSEISDQICISFQLTQKRVCVKGLVKLWSWRRQVTVSKLKSCLAMQTGGKNHFRVILLFCLWCFEIRMRISLFQSCVLRREWEFLSFNLFWDGNDNNFLSILFIWDENENNWLSVSCFKTKMRIFHSILGFKKRTRIKIKATLARIYKTGFFACLWTDIFTKKGR